MQMGKDCRCDGEVRLGPWGYQIGNEWSYRPKHGSIKQIIITYGYYRIISSVKFKGSHDGDYSTEFGGKVDDHDLTVNKIDIDFPAEYLTGISGTYGSINCAYGVCSLTFHTNKNEYGPFGTPSSKTFSANANGGGIVTGFHGLSDKSLGAIGVYYVPACSLSTEFETKPNPEISTTGLPRFLSPPRSAAAIGGSNGGREWDDGVFAAVKGVHVRVRIDTGVLSAVQFSYVKNNGSDLLSPFHGGDCGGDMHKKTIIFSEEDEYLIGIEGFYGEVEGLNVNVVKSMSFITNKAKYGPIGAEIGTYFTSMNFGDCNRKRWWDFMAAAVLISTPLAYTPSIYEYRSIDANYQFHLH